MTPEHGLYTCKVTSVVINKMQFPYTYYNHYSTIVTNCIRVSVFISAVTYPASFRFTTMTVVGLGLRATVLMEYNAGFHSLHNKLQRRSQHIAETSALLFECHYAFITQVLVVLLTQYITFPYQYRLRCERYIWLFLRDLTRRIHPWSCRPIVSIFKKCPPRNQTVNSKTL